MLVRNTYKTNRVVGIESTGRRSKKNAKEEEKNIVMM
jgi:hypothetical protein